MGITTEEFEQRLNDLLAKMEDWERCEWCGCDPLQRRITAKSRLCNSCKQWKRRELKAEKSIREHPDRVVEHEFMGADYDIEYAALCREEGHICSWKGPVTPLKLEMAIESISERLCGEDIFHGTIFYFEHFSEAQRRLLMFLFEELTKVWVRNRRRPFAIDRVLNKVFPQNRPEEPNF